MIFGPVFSHTVLSHYHSYSLSTFTASVALAKIREVPNNLQNPQITHTSFSPSKSTLKLELKKRMTEAACNIFVMTLFQLWPSESELAICIFGPFSWPGLIPEVRKERMSTSSMWAFRCMLRPSFATMIINVIIGSPATMYMKSSEVSQPLSPALSHP